MTKKAAVTAAVTEPPSEPPSEEPSGSSPHGGPSGPNASRSVPVMYCTSERLAVPQNAAVPSKGGRWRCPSCNSFLQKEIPQDDPEYPENYSYDTELIKAGARGQTRATAFRNLAAEDRAKALYFSQFMNPQSDPRDLRIAELEAKEREASILAHIDQRFAQMQAQFSRENGKSPENELFGKVLTVLAERALQLPPQVDNLAIASKALETVKSWGSIATQNEDLALRRDELAARVEVAKWGRADAAAAAEAASRQMERLFEMGKDGIEKIASPVAHAFEEGIRDRFRGRTAPGPPKSAVDVDTLDFAKMSPSEREDFELRAKEFRQHSTEVERKIQSAISRLEEVRSAERAREQEGAQP